MKVTEMVTDVLQSEGEHPGRIIPDDKKMKIRILALAALGLLLSVKSDRYFPLPDRLSEPI
ncbi:hypothetical protein, partial [Methanothrix sp.]|uniref:hypothetical protein n=1 Tax=Methanothrix sp. TaxID=90426 RepID=UPI003BAF215A